MTDREAPSPYEVLQVRDDAAQVVIEAAFRALARLHHPDRNPAPAALHRMAELNRAYAVIRTRELREAYDQRRRWATFAVDPGPVNAPQRAEAPRPDVLDFGRYAGWTLRELSRHDPTYLQWLSRHSSGIRHRQRIAELLDERERAKARQPTSSSSRTSPRREAGR